MKSLILLAAIIAANGLARATADIMIDNLCIVDQELYDNSVWSFCGGDVYFGESYNAEGADICPITEDAWVTAVTVDYFTFYGMQPQWICARAYMGHGMPCGYSVPQEDAAFADVVSQNAFEWIDLGNSLFGVPLYRAIIRFSEPHFLSSGCWYFSLQASSVDDVYSVVTATYHGDECFTKGKTYARDGSLDDPCCAARGFYSNADWRYYGEFEQETFSMRIEGVPAGDCGIGGTLSAKCKAGKGKIVAKVKGATSGGVLTCWLDATPGPRQDMTITPDGKGKTVFRNVAPGGHTVTMCDQSVDVTCQP